jgi:hypothetical protein
VQRAAEAADGRQAGPSLNNQPYVVPICFSFIPEKNCLYLFRLSVKDQMDAQKSKGLFATGRNCKRANWTSG